MGKIIGIDLGTTNSVLAVADGIRPRVLDTTEGRPQLRSMVSIKRRAAKRARGGSGDGGEILCGDPAEDNWEMAPEDTIYSVKRLMGRSVGDPEVQRIKGWAMYGIVEPSDGTRDSVRVVMGGKEYSPIDISAMILEKMKRDAEYRLNDEVTHTVITVPAYFSQIQRDATRRAAVKAGLRVVKILDEPTAAAIAFGVEFQEGSDARYLLVYDLGGGTFDISVLMWAGEVFAPLSLQGNMWLGGDNFDQAIVEHAVERIRQEYGIDPMGNKRFMIALRRKARAAKEMLSNARSADIIIPGLLRDEDGDLVDVDLEVTREQFEAMVRPMIDQTVRLTAKALENAGITPDQVHYVLMAGNATNVPLVQQAMEEMFGKEKVLRKIHPKHCVALGAAILAQRIGERQVCQAPDPADPERECGHVNPPYATQCEKCGVGLAADEAQAEAQEGPEFVIGSIAPFHYGIQTAGDRFNIFIHKGDSYPTRENERKPQTFYTQIPNQPMISIPVYGGEDTERASSNEKQGEAFAILPPALPAGTPVRVTIWLNADGIFDLTATLGGGTDLRPWILKGDQDHKAVEILQEVERQFQEKAEAADPEVRRAIQEERAAVFDLLREHRFEEAVDRARKAEAMVGGLRPPKDELHQKADNLIGYAEFIVSRYGWALGADRAYRLNKLIEEARSALESNNRQALEAAVKKLDRATDTDALPQTVAALMGIRGAIFARVKPANPGLADELLRELDQVEAGLEKNDATALNRLPALVDRVKSAIEASGGPGLVAKCGVCGHQLGAERHCPNCGADSWILRDSAQKASSTDQRLISH